jgi:peptidoglycan biosynthesis protein MviN/MurJ (putative lipid II flippase)
MFLKVESYRKGILLSTVFNVFNKGLVFLNSLAIAYFFGTQLKVDLYFYAYNTVLLIVTFITSLNSSVVIPRSMHIRMQEKPETVYHYFNFFIYLYFALTAVLCLLFYINPIRAFTTLSNYNPAILQSQAAILYLSVPLVLLATITTLLADILTSYRFFTIPMIAAMINSLFSFLFIILFHKKLDVRSITLGLLISYSVNILLLLFLLKRYLHWSFKFRFVSLGKNTWSNIGYAQAGNFVTTLGSYAPLYFLSGIGTGVIAALNYAQQIATQPTSFITNQFASVSRIKISELYAKKELQRVNEIFLSTTKFLMFIMMPISGIFFLYGNEIVTVLFKRGSFDAQSVKMSSDFLRYLGLSLPFTVIISIAGNLYIAAQFIKLSIGYQIISNLLLILLVYFSLHWFGYIGYPLAYLGVNVLNVAVVYIFCRLFFPFIHYTEILKYLTLLVGINSTIIVALELLGMLKIHAGAFVVLVAGTTFYGAAILLTNFIFNLNADFSLFLSHLRLKLTGRNINP